MHTLQVTILFSITIETILFVSHVDHDFIVLHYLSVAFVFMVLFRVVQICFEITFNV
jgi:hypothetical protein